MMNTREIFWCSICNKSQKIDDSQLTSTKTCPDCNHTLVLARIGFNIKRFVVMSFALGLIISLFLVIGEILVTYTLTTLMFGLESYAITNTQQVQLSVALIFCVIGIMTLAIVKTTQRYPVNWEGISPDSTDLRGLDFKYQIAYGAHFHVFSAVLALIPLNVMVFIIVFLI